MTQKAAGMLVLSFVGAIDDKHLDRAGMAEKEHNFSAVSYFSKQNTTVHSFRGKICSNVCCRSSNDVADFALK